MARAKSDAQAERLYQGELIKRLKREFPGCIILKNDSGYLQGIPDLTILYEDRWATLEVKASEESVDQPNQEYYVEKMNAMSYSAFIYPEIEEEVLNGLEQALLARRPARLSERQ